MNKKLLLKMIRLSRKKILTKKEEQILAQLLREINNAKENK